MDDDNNRAVSENGVECCGESAPKVPSKSDGPTGSEERLVALVKACIKAEQGLDRVDAWRRGDSCGGTRVQLNDQAPEGGTSRLSPYQGDSEEDGRSPDPIRRAFKRSCAVTYHLQAALEAAKATQKELQKEMM